MLSHSSHFRRLPGKRTQRASTLVAGWNPARRTVSKGLLLRVSPVVLVLLGALVFAGSALAAIPEIPLPTPTPEVIPETPSVPPPEIPTSPPTLEATPETPPAPTLEPTPETPAPIPTPEIPAPEPTPETPPPTPTPEPTPETPPPTPTPEPTPETPPPAPEATPETPPPETTREAPPTATPETTTETTQPPAPEAAAKSSPNPPLAASPDAVDIPPEAADVPIGPLPTASAVGGPGRTAATSSTRPASAAGVVAAQQALSLRCELAGLEGRMSGKCTGGSLDAQRLFATSLLPVGSANPGASSTAATVTTPTDDDPGGSAARSHPPVSPAPSPAPGGASGGSAGGASGVGLSASLTLGALLRLAPARAMRRLRLSCEPWLTACFVLIPERPG
jgi:hypothetical protein